MKCPLSFFGCFSLLLLLQLHYYRQTIWKECALSWTHFWIHPPTLRDEHTTRPATGPTHTHRVPIHLLCYGDLNSSHRNKQFCDSFIRAEQQWRRHSCHAPNTGWLGGWSERESEYCLARIPRFVSLLFPIKFITFDLACKSVSQSGDNGVVIVLRLLMKNPHHSILAPEQQPPVRWLCSNASLCCYATQHSSTAEAAAATGSSDQE